MSCVRRGWASIPIAIDRSHRSDGAALSSGLDRLTEVRGILVPLVALLMLASLPANASTPLVHGGIPDSALPVTHSGGPLNLRPPHLGIPARPVGSTGTGLWYTQEGATISQLDHSLSVGGTPRLMERFILVTSPYSTGYELNGLSNAGDWFQVVVGYDWPGCQPGFEELTQVWDATGVGSAVGCDSTVSLRAGNLVQLNLTFAANHNACLSLWDVSTGLGQSVCRAAPDAGGANFVAQGTQSNLIGYYSGPMTEIVNLTATDCPVYAYLPAVDYDFLNTTWITGVIPWSDEWNYGGNGTFCFGSAESPYDLGSPSPATQYVDTAAGTPFGPRWAAIQNLSPLRAGFTLRYGTDPVPLLGVTLTASATVVSAGGPVTLNVSGLGGVPPYRALLILNGSSLGIHSTPFTITLTAPATYTFSAYVVDQTGAMFGPSGLLQVVVPGALTVWSIRAAPDLAGADVGQSTTFWVKVTGGIGARTYSWSGLPFGCLSVSRPTIVCTPDLAGTNLIHVRVDDSNGSTAYSTLMSFRVSPALLGVLNASRFIVDVSQSIVLSANVQGGSGGFSYSWSGLPSGCLPVPAVSLTCAPSTPGVYGVGFGVTDSNGVGVRVGPMSVTVFPPLVVVISSDRSEVDAGVPLHLDATISGGSGGVQFTWVGLPSECPATVGPSVNCTPAQSSSWTVAVSVVDRSGVESSSATLAIVVYPAPLIRLTAEPGAFHVGESVTVSVLVVGGGPGIRFDWVGLPPGCAPANRASLTCSLASAGDFRVTVVVTDPAGSTVSTATMIHVAPPESRGLIPGGIPALFGITAAVALVVGVGAWVWVRHRRG